LFYSTNDAIRQGLKADSFEKQRWFSLREMFKDQCKRALDNNMLNLASMFATQAQFCREALNAKNILMQYESDRKTMEIINQC
jgi:hypothetical protein